VGVDPEPDRDRRRDDERALEEIRLLFARYRQIARHGQVTERDEVPEAGTEQTKEDAVPSAR